MIQAMFGLVLVLAGCQRPAPTDMTLQRGSQLLAAGSPASAIPFLSQTIASTPDGPEPIALLALAFALDMQADRAIAEAGLVHRSANSPPGWEVVAVSIAEMVQRRPGDAQANLARVVATAPLDTVIGQSSRQWLALAYLLGGDRDKALETLQELATVPSMKTSAMLWVVLIQAHAGRTPQASEALARCVTRIAMPGPSAPEGDAEGQALYDSAVAAMAARDFDTAQARFAVLVQKGEEDSDVPVWLALITVVRGDWHGAQALLREACSSGSRRSRGLANQLLSVAFAMEDRPDAMIEHLLAGQRLLGRNSSPNYVVEQPKPDIVWFSDHMK